MYLKERPGEVLTKQILEFAEEERGEIPISLFTPRMVRNP
jgi:hypothetical protein